MRQASAPRLLGHGENRHRQLRGALETELDDDPIGDAKILPHDPLLGLRGLRRTRSHLEGAYFHRQLFDIEVAPHLVDGVYGGVVQLKDSFLRKADRREMLVRLLTHLKGVYVNVGDHERALAAVERILLVTPTAPAEKRSRGVLLARMGRHEEAAEQLREYLRDSPGAADARRVEQMLRDLRAGITPPDDLEGL